MSISRVTAGTLPSGIVSSNFSPDIRQFAASTMLRNSQVTPKPRYSSAVSMRRVKARGCYS
jgi:hypothetical protein